MIERMEIRKKREVEMRKEERRDGEGKKERKTLPRNERRKAKILRENKKEELIGIGKKERKAAA